MELQYSRDIILTNPLHLVCLENRGEFFRIEIFTENGTFGIDPNHLDVGILLLKILADSANGAAGSDSANEVIDLPARLFPYLRTGRSIVRFGIFWIVILIGENGVGRFTNHSFCHFGIALGGLVRYGRRSDDDLCSKGPEEADLLDAHLIGHGKNALVSLDRGSDCKAKPGVPRGRFDYGPARFEPAFSLGLFDDPDSNPIFHRSPRIEVLHLGKHQGFHPRGDL